MDYAKERFNLFFFSFFCWEETNCKEKDKQHLKLICIKEMNIKAQKIQKSCKKVSWYVSKMQTSQSSLYRRCVLLPNVPGQRLGDGLGRAVFTLCLRTKQRNLLPSYFVTVTQSPKSAMQPDFVKAASWRVYCSSNGELTRPHKQLRKVCRKSDGGGDAVVVIVYRVCETFSRDLNANVMRRNRNWTVSARLKSGMFIILPPTVFLSLYYSFWNFSEIMQPFTSTALVI